MVMKKAMYKRKNPLIALVVTPVEYEFLKNSAKDHGISIAQLARGFLRYSISESVNPVKISLSARLGVM